jgi:hypothetical protein
VRCTKLEDNHEHSVAIHGHFHTRLEVSGGKKRKREIKFHYGSLKARAVNTLANEVYETFLIFSALLKCFGSWICFFYQVNTSICWVR